MYVSRLRSVPVGTHEYYLYVVDAAGGAHSELVDSALDRLARESGPKTLVVSGPEDLSRQLYEFLSEYASDFAILENLLHEVTCILVSRGSLLTTRENVYIIPLITRDLELEEFIPVILDRLLHCINNESVAAFCSDLGFMKFPLRGIDGGIITTTLRKLNEYIELKPTIAGAAFDMNRLIEDALGPAERRSS